MANIGTASIHFLLLVFLSSLIIKFGTCNGALNVSCIETERKALLNFKKGLTDPSGRLSSWVGRDCCSWRGVVCSHLGVIKLKLRNQYASSPDSDGDAAGAPEDDSAEAHELGGEINPSLLDLKYLRYLDLSMNYFGGIEIPNFFGSFKKLIYLNLSGSSFGGAIPPHIGNLSALIYLDLNQNSLELVDDDLYWLSGLSYLRHLNLGSVDLSKAKASWHRAVNSLSSLLELRLPRCGLSSFPDQTLLAFDNITSLTVLDLSNNGFNSSIPNWLFNFSNLQYLDLNSNNLQGSVPEGFGFMISLEHIDLSSNLLIGGQLPGNLGNLCNLRFLKLSFNDMSGEITEFIDGLSECVNGSSLQYLDLGYNYKLAGFVPNSLGQLKSLKSLHLWSNSFKGSIPNSIGNLTSLHELYLSNNQMDGIIPESLGRLSEMVALDLSENPWVGVVTESHFSNLTSLTELAIKKSSPNISLVFNVSSDWIPPFKLNYLELQSCQLGPQFPAWLRNQNRLKTIVLNNARISDSIPDWFWKLDLQLELLDFASNQLTGRVPNSLIFAENAFVDLSSNRFQGPLPHFSSNLSTLYLRDNLFFGTIPRDIGNIMPVLSNFDLSWNSLNGTIPESLGNISGLTSLVLSNNHLSGEIPLIWNDKPDLYIADMANNSLSGEIPSSMGTLNSLMYLALSGNKLSGKIPSSLRNCKEMYSLDLGSNRLSGNFPPWIGEMKSLLILRLRSNFLDGKIPSRVCSLSQLHILDLAHNNLSGTIPSCLGNLAGMATEIDRERYEGQLSVVMKGRELVYQNTLFLVNSIDLSDNNLSGKLPGLRNLSRLGTLNLSRNHFTGNLPDDIGSLRQLETLDLSRNQLSGPIPPTMVSLTSLNHLNLSYNRLSGKIPTGNQFQTLNDPSIYRNNPALCGEPLPVKCQGDDDDDEATGSSGMDDEDEDHDDEHEMKWFFVSMGIGFVVGFWGTFGPLILNRNWRGAYFRFLGEIKDRAMVVISVNVASLRKKCKWERNQH